eukprot:1371145-Heterocapsa_arctica.AAC.1
MQRARKSFKGSTQEVTPVCGKHVACKEVVEVSETEFQRTVVRGLEVFTCSSQRTQISQDQDLRIVTK